MDKQAYDKSAHKMIFEYKHQILNTLREDLVYTYERFDLNLNVLTFDWNMIVQCMFVLLFYMTWP